MQLRKNKLNEHGITFLEFLIALSLMMLVIPCIVSSSIKDFKTQRQSKLIFLDKLDNKATSCSKINTNGFNLLKCKNKNNEYFYKIK